MLRVHVAVPAQGGDANKRQRAVVEPPAQERLPDATSMGLDAIRNRFQGLVQEVSREGSGVWVRYKV